MCQICFKSGQNISGDSFSEPDVWFDWGDHVISTLNLLLWFVMTAFLSNDSEMIDENVSVWTITDGQVRQPH